MESVRQLSQLPGARAEIEAIAAHFGACSDSTLMGEDATETNLAATSAEGPLSEARVVVLATHGLVAGAFDGLAEPALALTPPRCRPALIDPAPEDLGIELAAADAATDPACEDPALLSALASAAQRGARVDDRLWTASEAARLDLDADWVVLSACDTAAGAENAPDAEGLSGLARAFFYAGARSLLVSHCPVRDDVAARLTTDAIARTDAGASRPEAFQTAMRALMADPSGDARGQSLAHPAAWARFEVTGVDATAQ